MLLNPKILCAKNEEKFKKHSKMVILKGGKEEGQFLQEVNGHILAIVEE